MSDHAITATGLAKRYGRREALRGVDLQVPTGSFCALLGPNGAGKTTFMRCLMGLIRPDGGMGQVLGAALGPGYPPLEVKTRIGYVSQQHTLYERMTANDLAALYRDLHPRWDAGAVRRYLDLFNLAPDLPVRQMSLGMRSQLALTLVMGSSPELLLLDEPTLGLDPLNRRQYLQVLLADSMESGRTVLISSHDLDQVERLADRVVMLREGRVVCAGALDDLKETEKRVRVAGQVTQAILSAVPGVRKVTPEGHGWLLFVRGEAPDLRARLGAVPGVTGVQILDQSLEEIFISYVS